MNLSTARRFVAILFLGLLAATAIAAQTPAGQPAPAGAGGGSAEDLAKQLSNPVASLISVPLQSNWDYNIGPAEAWRYALNVQPVIPVTIAPKWNLIVRTIVPVVYAESPVAGGENSFGLGDVVQSLFFSPKAPTASGWIWGAGPVFLWPTSTDRALGTSNTGAGPTALALKQQNGWTYGALGNHLASFAGPNTSPDVNATFVQPFVSFTTKKLTTWNLNTESTYDWEGEQWTVPLNLSVSQLVKLGRSPLQLSVGGRYYVEKPDGGPDWGLRFVVTFLFPK